MLGTDETVRALVARINELEDENRRLKEELKHTDPCEVCTYAQKLNEDPECNLECDTCTKKCKCFICEDRSNFKWRGEKDGT